MLDQGTAVGSEGCLLKYVPNPPDPTRFESALQVGGEDVAHGETVGSAKCMVNLPVGSSAAFRLSGYYAGVPGYIDDPSLGQKDVNHGYRAGLRASLLWHLTDNFSVRLSAIGQDLHTDGTPHRRRRRRGTRSLRPRTSWSRGGDYNQKPSSMNRPPSLPDLQRPAELESRLGQPDLDH